MILIAPEDLVPPRTMAVTTAETPAETPTGPGTVAAFRRATGIEDMATKSSGTVAAFRRATTTEAGVKATKYPAFLWGILLICCGLFPGGKISAQLGYYVKDTTIQAGVKPVDQGPRKNALEMVINYKTRTERFTPEEIFEYGFPDGRVFFSRVISVDGRPQRVFLERIGHGKLDLWFFAGYDGDRFFLERPSERQAASGQYVWPSGQQPESSLIELPEEDGRGGPFRALLTSFTADCDQVAEALKVVRFNRKSLAAFMSRYNTCSSRPMPIARFGVTTAVSFTHPGNGRPEMEGLARAGFNDDPALAAGLFADLPVFADGLTFHPEILYSENSWSAYSGYKEANFDFLISTASLQVPLLVRYTLPALRWRPFFNIGGTLTRHLRNDNTIYRTTVNDGVATIAMTTGETLTARDMAGYAIGGGLQVALDHRRSLFLEIRHNGSYPLQRNRMHLSSLYLHLSFNL